MVGFMVAYYFYQKLKDDQDACVKPLIASFPMTVDVSLERCANNEANCVREWLQVQPRGLCQRQTHRHWRICIRCGVCS